MLQCNCHKTQLILYHLFVICQEEVRKIHRKSKAFTVVFGVICGLLFIAVLLMLAVAVLFRSPGAAPEMFGHSIYIVKTDAFSVINNGTALITSKAGGTEINAGNIVVFRTDGSEALLGEVQLENYSDGVYTYEVKLSDGSLLTVGESAIIGKGDYYSDVLGEIIGFSSSPAGVACIAVVPCLLIIFVEIVKAIRRKLPEPEIETVRKQDETPTYTPPAYHKQSKPEPAAPSAARRSEPDPIGFGGNSQLRSDGDGPLFIPPHKRVKPAEEPLSSQRLSKAISETQSIHLRADKPAAKPAVRIPAVSDDEMKIIPPPAPKAVVTEEPESGVKQYVPKRQTSKTDDITTTLDKLLQEEPTDRRYNIDDILKSLEKK